MPIRFIVKKPTVSTSGILAAGREPFWRKSQPSLAADEETTGISEIEEDASSPSKTVSTIVKTVLIVAAMGIFLYIAGWIIFGLTVLPILHIGDASWAVKWAAYPQGQTPAKTVIADQTGPIQRDLMDRFVLLLGGPESARVQVVIATPGQKIATDPSGAITADGSPTGFTSATPIAEKLLGDSYLTLCITGDCTPSQILETPTNSVMGEVLGEFTPPISIGEPPSYPTNGR